MCALLEKPPDDKIFLSVKVSLDWYMKNFDNTRQGYVGYWMNDAMPGSDDFEIRYYVMRGFNLVEYVARKNWDIVKNAS